MKIVSGGQTGADRGALDWAIDHHVEHGGYCPNNRRAEDGKIPIKYRLIQTGSRNYLVRTEKNVQYSDATVIFMRTGTHSVGSVWTKTFCNNHNKPFLVIGETDNPQHDAERLAAWLKTIKPITLNFAGHRESSCPGLQVYVCKVLDIVQHLYPPLVGK
jgi:hypothetical protein